MTDAIPKLSDLAAERAILGGVLWDATTFLEIAGVVEPGDFAQPGHAAIFQAFQRLQTASPPRPIDAVTVGAQLRDDGLLRQAGGPGYLAELQGSVPTTANIRHYAEIVRQKAARRRLIEACAGISAEAADTAVPIEVVLDSAQQKVFGVASKQQQGALTPLHEVVDTTLAGLEDRLGQAIEGVTGLKTGLLDLDKLLTGLHPGELIVVAARPGIGKTSLAMGMALDAAVRSHVGVAVFSLEMPKEQLALRMLASEGRVSLLSLRQGCLGTAEQKRTLEASKALWAAPMWIDDSGSLSIFDLRARARRLGIELETRSPPVKLGLVVVDYLQLMHQHGAESRQAEVQVISRGLKSLAKELGVPIVALSQLNRKIEARKGAASRPMLSDLRESGSIEQDADVVLFIHRERGDDEDGGIRPQFEEVDLIVEKHRNGPTGSVKAVVASAYTRFDNLAPA